MSEMQAIDPMNVFLQEQLELLRTDWDALAAASPPAPAFSWDDWKEALLNLGEDPRQELLIRGALSAVVKMARFKPPYMILQELLTLTVSAADPASSRPLGSSAEDAVL
jgi:hypothetical protein